MADLDLTPKQGHYHTGQIDEFWTYLGKKKKMWVIYALEVMKYCFCD